MEPKFRPQFFESQDLKKTRPQLQPKEKNMKGFQVYIYIYIHIIYTHIHRPIHGPCSIAYLSWSRYLISFGGSSALPPATVDQKTSTDDESSHPLFFFSKVFFSWKSLALGGLNSHEGCILAQTWEANCFSFICFVFFLAWRGQWHFKRHPWHEKPKRTYLSTSQIQSTFTRWYPTSCKWSYNFYKWPYKIGNWDYNRYMWTYNRPHLITGFSVPTL